jgi:hypothetical protein
MEQASPYASPAAEAIEPKAGAGLAMAALVLPMLTGGLLFFVTSLALSLLISGMTTVTTAVLLAVDAYRLGRIHHSARQPDSPAVLLLGIIFIWIIVYPLAFFRRSRFGGPHLGIPAVGVALFFAVGPLSYALLQLAELPSCTSPMVIDLVEKCLRDMPDGAEIESIDRHKEVRYDRTRDIRHGVCVVQTKEREFDVEYLVEWEDRGTGRFRVRCEPLPVTLPRGDSRRVVEVLAQVLGNTDMGGSVQAIEGHEELRYDRIEDVRYCKCIVRTSEGLKEVRYVVEWLDRDSGYFGVRVPPVALPRCTSDEVVKVLEQVIRSAPLGPLVRSIDGHREVSYDPTSEVRVGRCIVHLTDEEIPLSYVVEWRDRERGAFQVRTLEE